MDAWRGCGAGVALGWGGAPAQATKRLEADEAGRVRRRGGSGRRHGYFRAGRAARDPEQQARRPADLVSNKGGSSGAETFVYVKAAAGDGQLAFGTSNLHAADGAGGEAYGFRTRGRDGVRRVRALEQGRLALQRLQVVYRGRQGGERDRSFKMAGALSKDTDQTLTRYIEDTGAKFIYVPFRSGGEASVQLTGGHVQSHVNNPSESLAIGAPGR